MEERSSADSVASVEATSVLTASHVAHAVRASRAFIAVTVVSVVVAYTIGAVAYYLFARAVRVTSLPFRLEFSGAQKGEYPNGTQFSSSDVISTPVLTRTFRDNELQRFTKPGDFYHSVFVIESNEARQALAREYLGRLSDPRLTRIDRERLEREYTLKTASLGKNELSVNYARRTTDSIPDALAEKVLHDILRNWVEHASREQHVLEYRVAVLSPNVVAGEESMSSNPIVAGVILRNNVIRLLENVKEIQELPNAVLIRSARGDSIHDLSVRLENVIRHRLDPLVSRAAAAGLDNRAETLRFLQSQLAYDQRILQSRIQTAEAAQQLLPAYLSPLQREPSRQRPGEQATKPAAETQTLMPELSDTFLDRLIQITTHSADADFRRQLAHDYRDAMLTVVPAREAVDYDRSTLELITARDGGNANDEEIAAELQKTRDQLRELAIQVKELHALISRNLNTATELVVPGSPTTRLERGVSGQRLILVGVLVVLLTLATALLVVLVRSRVEESQPTAE